MAMRNGNVCATGLNPKRFQARLTRRVGCNRWACADVDRRGDERAFVTVFRCICRPFPGENSCFAPNCGRKFFGICGRNAAGVTPLRSTT